MITNPFMRDLNPGITLLFEIGPITNPISTSQQTGYWVEVVDDQGGKVARGMINFKISSAAIISNSSD